MIVRLSLSTYILDMETEESNFHHNQGHNPIDEVEIDST
jgi:hypothetical protein